MKELSESNARLLCFGAKQTGSFIEAFDYVVESLYVNETEELQSFCKFIDNKVGGASIHNIFILFRAYKNPADLTLQKFVADLKSKIQEINDMLLK